MIKIGFPKDFGKIKGLFPEKEKENDLYIVCEEAEKSVVLGAVRFYYKGNTVEIHEVVMPYQGEQAWEVFDGMIRTLLFKMAEEECTSVRVHHPKDLSKKYFEDHGFIWEREDLVHHSFPGEFFKPCGGCSA